MFTADYFLWDKI